MEKTRDINRACGHPAARAGRPNKKRVQQLVNEPQAKDQEPSLPIIFALISAADSHLGDLNRVLESMTWQLVSVSEYPLGGR